MANLDVLIVDDTIVYRRVLQEAVLATGLAGEIQTASNAELALDRIRHNDYDVVLLDVVMPGMSGLDLLRIIRDTQPKIDVIMVSGNSGESSELTLKALELGALDFIVKPTSASAEKNLRKLKHLLLVLFAQIQSKRVSEAHSVTKLADYQLNDAKNETAATWDKQVKFKGPDIIVIAASTGGPLALKKVLVGLQDISVPILVVQHMPAGFTNLMAKSLNKEAFLPVRETVSNEVLKSGVIYIAAGGFHMQVTVDNHGQKKLTLSKTPLVNGVRPSADVLFASVADVYKKERVLALVLTGMGNDGLAGVKILKEQCHCYCIAQSHETCVVYGMSRSVVEAQLANEVAHLDQIASRITAIANEGR